MDDIGLNDGKSVEWYLDNVNYDFKGYLPKEDALLFVEFIKQVNGGNEENETPIVHLKLMDSVFNKDPMCAIMVARGMGKTTLFAEYLILFIAAFGYMPSFGNVDYILYVTDSIENGVRNLRRNVEFRYQNSDFLQQLIPNQKIKMISDVDASYSLDERESAVKAGVRFTDVRLEMINYRGEKLIVRGYGVSTGVRGTKEDGKRPTLAILDDLLSDDDARSETVIGNVNDIIYKAVDKALHPTNRKIIYLGTPFNTTDPLYVAVESGAWTASVFPICEKFPVPKSEFKGAWEDRFTYQSILRSHSIAVKVGKADAFYQEMMLRIHSDEDRLIDPKSIRKVDYNDTVDRDGQYYITTDFATSTKASSDFSAMVVWHHDSKDHYTIIDGYLENVLMEDNINALFDLVYRYRPMFVGVEVSGQQGGFISWIQSEMRRRGEYFTLAKQKGKEHIKDLGIRPNKNKILRLQSMLPLFNRGQISIAEDVVSSKFGKELFNELGLATKKGFLSRHDDAVDAMTQLMDISREPPTSDVEKSISDTEKLQRNMNKLIFGKNITNSDNTIISSYLV